MPERSIFDYELMYIMEGEVEVTVEKTVYRGIPGDIFLFKPRQHHAMSLVGTTPLRQPHVHFDLIYQPDSPEVKVCFQPFERVDLKERRFFREDLLSVGPMKLPNFIRLHRPSIVKNLMLSVIDEWNLKLPYYEQTCKGLIIQLLSILLRETTRPGDKRVSLNREVLYRVQLHLLHNKDRAVTIDEMTALTHFSPHHLIRQFKTAYGVTPVQYHHRLRMQRARELLKLTAFSISQISEQLGFASVTIFSKTFKKSEGVSPMSFRKLKRLV